MSGKMHPAVKQALRPVRRRVHISHAVRFAGVGVLLACASCALWTAASYILPIPGLPILMAASALGALLLAVLAGLLLPVSWETAARHADAGGLKERALTALFVTEDTPMALLQREDAMRHIKSLPMKTAVPLKMGRRPLAAAAAVALLVTGALVFIPNPQNAVLKGLEAFQKVMAEQAEIVEEEAGKLEESRYTKEELAALRKLLGDLARELRDSSEPQQAYLAMDKAQRELQDLQNNESDASRMEAAQAFSQSGLKDVSEALAKNDAQAAAQAVEQLANAQAGASSNASALAQASAALPEGALQQAAAQTAKALNAGDPQSISAAISALSSAVQSTCSGSSSGTSSNLSNISSLLAQVRSGTLSASQMSSAAAGTGQGSGNGTGSGSGSGAQQGSAGPGAGKGSTNLDGGVSKAGTSAQQDGTNPAEYKLGKYETIYDPTRLDGADDVYQATGAMGEGESQQLQLDPGLGSASGQVPFQQVILEYQQAASKAAQQESLPEGMQLWVDGYFQALID